MRTLAPDRLMGILVRSGVLVFALAMSSCNCGWVCTSAPTTNLNGGPTTCAPKCCAHWECGSDVYDVTCTPDGGLDHCDCIKNGVTTGQFTDSQFCDNDAWAYTANGRCGWKVAGKDGVLPGPP